MLKPCLWAAVTVVGLALAGWGQTKPAAKPVHARAAAPAAHVPDAEIEKDIRARFARSKINADHFEVRVQGGVATLTGRTDVIQHKGVATRMAKNGGATSVVNKIQVSQAARDRANANLAKGRRRAQVMRGEARSETR
jgi:hypothetical protein